MTDLPEFTDTFTIPCLTCGVALHVVGGTEEPHDCVVPATTQGLIARAYWAGFDSAYEHLGVAR